MSYDYQTEKKALFTEEGQREFIDTRDKFMEALRETGVVRAGLILTLSGGDSWMNMAMLDRMVEMADVRYVETKHPRMWQDQIVELDR